MFKLKISSKVLLFFLIVSLLPLFTATIVLVSSGKSLLLQSAVTRQQFVAQSTANALDTYLANKISALNFQSRLYTIGGTNDSNINKNLSTLTKLDPELQQIAVVDLTGQEQVLFDKNGQDNDLTNLSNTDAYKSVTYINGKDFIGAVNYTSSGQPEINIAVPILKQSKVQNLTKLETSGLSNGNYTDNLTGVLIAKYNISNLWQSVLSTKIGNGGYAYVVDAQGGNLIAHPNKTFLATHHNIPNVQAVSQYRNSNFQTAQTTSEVGLKVISTPRKLNLANWAVIVEEPSTSVYAGINSFIKISIIIIVVAVLLSVAMSLVFRKQLLDPIKKLIVGVKRIEARDFNYEVKVNTNDELQELASSFNNMSQSIRQLIGDLQVTNVSLTVEQAQLNNIIRSVSDGVIALNENFEIISINPPAAKLIKQEPEALIGKVLDNLYLLTSEGKRFIPELSKPGIYHYSDLVLQSGSDVSYLDIVVSILDSKDSQATAIITVHDLTQSRELEFMKLDFVAIAAHELRTPLTVVQGYLSILNEDAVKKMTLFNIENLQKAIVGADQLRNLINKLLNISRIERGEMEISIQKLDLTKLVRDVVDQHQGAAAQKLQRVLYSANTDSTVFVPGDSSSISEVLNNLIGNALKFTEADGVVNVNLKVEGENVRVEVVDTGPGIRLDLQSRLFTKFYRAERSLVSGYRGTGLGLYISKTIIEMHHGKIGVNSVEGKGSTFYFILPIYNDEKHAILLSKEAGLGGIRGWFKNSKRNTR